LKTSCQVIIDRHGIVGYENFGQNEEIG
jgi:hypothetical protein